MIRIGENFNKGARFSPVQSPDRPRPFSRHRQDGRDHSGGLTEMIGGVHIVELDEVVRPRSRSERPRRER
jgi:hypothetical protein